MGIDSVLAGGIMGLYDCGMGVGLWYWESGNRGCLWILSLDDFRKWGS